MVQQARPRNRPRGQGQVSKTQYRQTMRDLICRALDYRHGATPLPDIPFLPGTPSLPDISYDPVPKGHATWNNGYLQTSCRLVIAGPVHPYHYQYISGLDLVNWFTDTYLQGLEKVKQEEPEKIDEPYSNENSPRYPNPTYCPQWWGLNGRRPISSIPKPKPKPKPYFDFLELPNELRNTIYAWLIPESRILIRTNHPNKEFAPLQSSWQYEHEVIRRPKLRLKHVLNNDDIDNGYIVSIGIFLVNKKIHEEVKLMMYGRMVFCFDSINIVHHFIHGIGEENLKKIKKLELHNAGYGHAKLTDNERFKDKHDRAWDEMCVDIANNMPGLEYLKLDIQIRDWPAQLQFRDRWCKGLMKLAPNKLDCVEVVLSHKIVGQNRLAQAARRIEDHMMTEEGKKARDEKEAVDAIRRFNELEAAAKVARRERLRALPPVQASKVLRITLGQATSNNKARNKK